jgi:hypothetical protein
MLLVAITSLDSKRCKSRRLVLWSAFHAFVNVRMAVSIIKYSATYCCKFIVWTTVGFEVPSAVTVNGTIFLPTSCRFLVWLTHGPWRWRRCVHPRCRWTSTELNGFTFRKIVLLCSLCLYRAGPICVRYILFCHLKSMLYDNRPRGVAERQNSIHTAWANITLATVWRVRSNLRHRILTCEHQDWHQLQCFFYGMYRQTFVWICGIFPQLVTWQRSCCTSTGVLKHSGFFHCPCLMLHLPLLHYLTPLPWNMSPCCLHVTMATSPYHVTASTKRM